VYVTCDLNQQHHIISTSLKLSKLDSTRVSTINIIIVANMMCSILLFLIVLGFSNGFTSVGKFRHPPTALNGLGDRFKKLINRNQDAIAVLDRVEDVTKVEETEMDVRRNAIGSEDNEDTTSDVKSDVVTELSETQKLMKQVKDSGVAGVISYALWEVSLLM
jgi:hypothetical protein